MTGPKDQDQDRALDRDDTSTLDDHTADWYASRDGYSKDDAARDTDADRADVDQAHSEAAGDDPDTN